MRIVRLALLVAVVLGGVAVSVATALDLVPEPKVFPDGEVGQQFSYQFLGEEGCPPSYHFMLDSGYLPPGLVLGRETGRLTDSDHPRRLPLLHRADRRLRSHAATGRFPGQDPPDAHDHVLGADCRWPAADRAPAEHAYGFALGDPVVAGTRSVTLTARDALGAVARRTVVFTVR